ncbi:uncharacterized 30.3 kDa protein-like [Pectinophora gossypiella]|nr:uncharacterized 30.3 kDa protein-like [Pectinophora gossypiella]
MKTEYCVLIVSLLLGAAQCLKVMQDDENYTNVSRKYYTSGVDLGIINPDKYSFESFLRDERSAFQDLYQEYASQNGTANYSEWLIMNNFGILPDTQESLFERKISKRSVADNKRKFVNTVRRGDILISGRGIGGLLGHAAIMTTDYYVLEMRGGKGWLNGIKDNNRQVSKHAWFDEHQHDWTTVYRVPNSRIVALAARWADHTYYNPSGGAKKTKHITYRIDTHVWRTDPSYCSKLVVQAYYYGTGKANVIYRGMMRAARVIAPTQIPSYFMPDYKLKNMGRY